MPLITPEALARTYSLRNYRDAYVAVLDYETVLQYHAENPDDGSAAIGTQCGLPRGRVKSWLEGNTPYPVQAIEVGRDNGWFEATVHNHLGSCFNRLVAAVFAGGTITQRDYLPSFVLASSEACLREALETLVGGATVRHASSNSRATELVPEKAGSILGRALASMGAPVGAKSTSQFPDLSLPPYLEEAPIDLKREFLRIYVRHRAREARSGDQYLLVEDRPQAFHDELTALLFEITGVSAKVTSEGRVSLPPRAVADLI